MYRITSSSLITGRAFAWRSVKVRNHETQLTKGSVKDENTPQRLQEINERYKIIASRISSIVQA